MSRSQADITAAGSNPPLVFMLIESKLCLWSRLATGRRDAGRDDHVTRYTYYYMPLAILAAIVVMLASAHALDGQSLQFAPYFGGLGYLVTRLVDCVLIGRAGARLFAALPRASASGRNAG